MSSSDKKEMQELQELKSEVKDLQRELDRAKEEGIKERLLKLELGQIYSQGVLKEKDDDKEVKNDDQRPLEKKGDDDLIADMMSISEIEGPKADFSKKDGDDLYEIKAEKRVPRKTKTKKDNDKDKEDKEDKDKESSEEESEEELSSESDSDSDSVDEAFPNSFYHFKDDTSKAHEVTEGDIASDLAVKQLERSIFKTIKNTADTMRNMISQNLELIANASPPEGRTIGIGGPKLIGDMAFMKGFFDLEDIVNGVSESKKTVIEQLEEWLKKRNDIVESLLERETKDISEITLEECDALFTVANLKYDTKYDNLLRLVLRYDPGDNWKQVFQTSIMNQELEEFIMSENNPDPKTMTKFLLRVFFNFKVIEFTSLRIWIFGKLNRNNTNTQQRNSYDEVFDRNVYPLNSTIYLLRYGFDKGEHIANFDEAIVRVLVANIFRMLQHHDRIMRDGTSVVSKEIFEWWKSNSSNSVYKGVFINLPLSDFQIEEVFTTRDISQIESMDELVKSAKEMMTEAEEEVPTTVA